MKNRLFKKFFLSTTAAIVVSLVIIMSFLSVFVSSYFVNEKEKLLINNCKTITNVLSNETDNATNFHVSLNGILNVVSNAISGEVYVCDETGRVFICSCSEWKNEKSCEHSKTQLSNTIIDNASDGKFFEIGHLDGRFRNIYYTAAMPFFTESNEIAGYVFISSAASLIKDMWSELWDIYLICNLVPITLMFIFIYIMTKKITKPLNLMSQAAISMSKGDFSKRIPIAGDDEISDLAKTFNSMSNSLSQLESMRRSFVANVSHELRTPMTTIGGFIDGILDGTIPKDKHEYYLNIVSAETKRLSRLVQSMLSLARLESGEQKVNLTEFALTDLICEVLVSQEQRITDKNIDITGLDVGNDIKITADRDLIYQAVFNLVDNAIKFSPESKTISFDISKQGNIVLFKIKNEGKGINPEELQYIFDRFYKTDKARSANKDGTGLGLYITKTIIDIHKGNISVSSKPDAYTEFIVEFHPIIN